jgi:protein tyrosine phosphatase (PTP) superfamily phosphohydrolase (DUF442 family)
MIRRIVTSSIRPLCQIRMANTLKKVSNDIFAAGQLTEDELRKEISDHGFKTIINIRGENEEGYTDESSLCGQQGVKYSHHPTSKNSKEWSTQMGQQIVNDLSNSPKPILIHCAGANRAITFALLREVKDHGVDFEVEADRVGLKAENFRKYGKEYLEKK